MWAPKSWHLKMQQKGLELAAMRWGSAAVLKLCFGAQNENLWGADSHALMTRQH